MKTRSKFTDLKLLNPNHVLGQTIESGDLLAEIGIREKAAIKKDSGGYVAPTTTQRDQFRLLASTLLAGDIATADALANGLNYELVRFTDTVTGRVYHELRETAGSPRGWGTYILERSGDPDVTDYLIQSPHPVFDINSWDIAAKVFRESRARGFLMAGAHRNANGKNTADVADPIGSIFQEVHKAWNDPDRVRCV